MKHESSTLTANLILASTAVVVGAHIVAWKRKDRARKEIAISPIGSPAEQQADKAVSGGPWCGSGMPFSLRSPWESCEEALNALANIGLEPSHMTPTNESADSFKLSAAVLSFQRRYNFWRSLTILLEDGKLGVNTGTALAEVASTYGIPVDVRNSPTQEISDWWKTGTQGKPIGKVDPGDPTVVGVTMPRAVDLVVASDSDYNAIDNATHAHVGLRAGKQKLLEYINYILAERALGSPIEYRQIPIELAIQTSEGGEPQDHTHPQVVARSQAEMLADGQPIELQAGWGDEVGSTDKEWHRHEVTMRATIEQVEI